LKKITNPFIGKENYNCFGCSPDNPHGLRMEFFEKGDEILSIWNGKDYFAGFENILHGGIQATIMDEIASWVVFVKLETGGFTSNLNVQYKQPVSLDKGNITIRASLKEMKKNIAFIDVSLFDGDGKLCSVAVAQYFTLPEKIARKKLRYPGIESFREE
jgi:acyl-coenzyme A thioesterase PaaI-like protein